MSKHMKSVDMRHKMKHVKHNSNFKAIADTKRPKKLAMLLSFMAVIAIAAGGWVVFQARTAGKQEKNDYSKLVGDWVRPDGGYVIHISSINPDGTIQAAYFNPSPIHIAAANVALHNNTIKLFVELRDVGYPGSKYDLVYMSDDDILQGTYFQAQIQELYDVVFLRKK